MGHAMLRVGCSQQSRNPVRRKSLTRNKPIPMLPFARSIAPGRPPVTSRWRILDWELQLSQMRLLEMAVVPIQDALEHVDVVRHLPRRVALARIENHLSFDSEMLERAIEP